MPVGAMPWPAAGGCPKLCWWAQAQNPVRAAVCGADVGCGMQQRCAQPSARGPVGVGLCGGVCVLGAQRLPILVVRLEVEELQQSQHWLLAHAACPNGLQGAKQRDVEILSGSNPFVALAHFSAGCFSSPAYTHLEGRLCSQAPLWLVLDPLFPGLCFLWFISHPLFSCLPHDLGDPTAP